ncbi:hypothetical protein FS749_013515, partial [Ceratobasidium sp. UAMH 11750]
MESFDFDQLANSACLANLVTPKSPASSQPAPTNENELGKQPLDEEPDADNDNDYFAEGDEDYIKALIKRQLEENMPLANSPDSLLESPATPSPSLPDLPPADIPISELLRNEPPFQRSLLVASEADVLPIVCIFAQGYDKVICYLDCPLPSIMLFQKIIKGVTGASVYAATRASASELNSLCRAFNKQTQAILLLHETVHSDLTITTTNGLCVIHAGWPCDADRYFAQINLHNAPRSILVACSDYQNLYPSCAKVLDRASPWPENDNSAFEREIVKLRPKFEDVLDGIPMDMKSRFYSDWIELHGPRGQRYVPSWAPTTLVAHANLYLRDVIQYPTQEVDPADSETPRRILPPSVSMEFVTANNLEPALGSGILKVVRADPKLGNSSNQFDVADPAAGSQGSAPVPAPIHSTLPKDPEEPKGLGAATEIQPASPNGTKNDTNPVGSPIPRTGQPEPLRLRYLLAAEGDVLPLACSLIQDYDRVVCYVAYCDSMLDLFVQMLHKAAGDGYVIINGMSDLNGATPLESQLSADQRGILVFPNYEIASHDIEAEGVLHVGWPTDYRTYLAQLAQHKSDISILVAYEQDADISHECAETVAYTLPYGNKLDLDTKRLSDSFMAVQFVLNKTPLSVKARIYS